MIRVSRFILNTTSVSVFSQYQMAKAKSKYKKMHNVCACCGYKKKLEIHHVIPVHIDKELACYPGNFITLCRDCHFRWGHFHNFRTNWNPYIKEFCLYVSDYYRNVDLSSFSMPIKDLIT